jgi:predicted dehydrogenase
MSDGIRWGILSTARIGTQKGIPAMQRAADCQVVAIASRTPERAEQAAQELGISQAFGSYEELLADPDVDAIYNPLPNHLHVPWSIRALQAGKHVLCEKPLGLTSAEAQELVDEAARYPDLKVMEAFMYRHHPQWRKALELIEQGTLGRLMAIDTVFSYNNRNPEDIRNQAEIGGGGLMDIGCYPISLSRFLFQGEPTRVIGRLELDPEFGVDRLAAVLMEFPTGTSSFVCSTQMAPFQRVQILGTEGRYEIEIPFNAPPERPCRAWLQTASGVETLEFPVCDQYTLQAELFAQAILRDEPVPTPLIDGVRNMRVIEAIRESTRTGNWIPLD